MAVRFEDQAFILHKRAYRESSYIIDLLTRSHGIVSVIAKGAKSNKSRFYLNLQLFHQLEVAFSGKSELMTLTQVDVISSARIAQKKNIFCGYYINELLLRLLHKHDQYSQLFDHYSEIVSILAHEAEPEPVLRNFEKALLIEIGYGVDFSSTVDGDNIEDDKYYFISPEQGVMPAVDKKASGLMVQGKTLSDLSAGIYSDRTSLQESKQVMRQILQYHLGSKPLKTRELFARATGE